MLRRMTMLSKEYLESALKHLFICRKLSEYIASDVHNIKYYASTIYYLSGYVFEGIICYMTYKKLNWESKDIYLLDTKDWVFQARKKGDKRKQICKHRYTTMLEYLSSDNPDLEHDLQALFNKYKSKNQFERWNTAYRYKCSTIWKTPSDILSYVEFCQEVYILLRKAV